jgi:hypothetical protein
MFKATMVWAHHGVVFVSIAILRQTGTVMTSGSPPRVYGAVRAVGVLRPRFNPAAGQGFSNELNVIGTAFWLKEFKVLVTCSHVVSPLFGPAIETTGMLVVGNAGNYRRAVIQCLDLQHDLAVLSLVANTSDRLISGTELDQEASSGLELVSSYEPVATAVAYVGFPLGLQLMNEVHSPTYSEGVIGVELKGHSLARKEVQISGAVIGGFSGSPVVTRGGDNRVIGVVSGGPAAGPGQGGDFFMAVSWEHVVGLAKLAAS